MNRNRIRGESGPNWLTLSVRKASYKLPINQREYLLAEGEAVGKIERKLYGAYAKAPHFAEGMPAIRELLETDDANVANFNARSLADLARRLGIGCRFETSSRIGKPEGLAGQARILDLCRRIGADDYINPIGGISLYNREEFHRAGIELSFLRTTVDDVVLANGPCQLSVIDHIMMRGALKTAALLGQHVVENA
ncbi:hypothetical protein GCM10028795_24180 [Lysobacter olei]